MQQRQGGNALKKLQTKFHSWSKLQPAQVAAENLRLRVVQLNLEHRPVASKGALLSDLKS